MSNTVLAHKTAPDGLYARQTDILETASGTVFAGTLTPRPPLSQAKEGERQQKPVFGSESGWCVVTNTVQHTIQRTSCWTVLSNTPSNAPVGAKHASPARRHAKNPIPRVSISSARIT